MKFSKSKILRSIRIPRYCYCKEAGGMHLIKLSDSENYKYGRVMLARLHWYSNRLTPFDADTGKRLYGWMHYIEEEKKYIEVDLNSVTSTKIGYRIRRNKEDAI